MALITLANWRFEWFSTSSDVTMSPERLLDLVAVVLAAGAIHILRSLHRTHKDANLVIATSIVLTAGTRVVTGALLPHMATSTAQWLYLSTGISMAALTIVAMFEVRTPDRFGAYVPLALGAAVIAGGFVAAASALTGPEVSFSAAVASVSFIGAMCGFALTVVGLRKSDVARQVLGLLALSAATLGTQLMATGTDVAVMAHKLTFVGLLGTLAIHLVVELRNTTVAAQSTSEQITADLDLSISMLRQQREERAQLIHDSRSALLVIQACLQSVANDDSDELIASLNSELNRIQAMIERNHTPIEPVDIIETLAPMVRCYDSGGIPLVIRVADPYGPQPLALASRTQLVEVMQNLIENAIRHAKSDRPIEISVAAVDENIEIEVRDHGIGIDLRDRPHVAGRVLPKSGFGTGQGLSICHRLMAEMEGELDFFLPNYGQGSIFRVKLPQAGLIRDPAVA
jgi:signal transduction histidine kinase